MSFVGLAEEELSMENCLQFALHLWRSISNFDTDTNTYSISSIRNRTTPYKHMCATRIVNQHFLFVCGVEVNVATEERHQLQCATVPKVMPISAATQTPTDTRLREHPPPLHRLSTHVLKMNWQWSTLPPHLSGRSQHRNREAHTMLTPTRTYLRIRIRRSTIQLGLSSGNYHRHGEGSAISTPTAKQMFGTARLRMGISDTPASWSSSCNKVIQHDTDHNRAEQCVTFGGAVDWKSRELKWTAQSITEYTKRQWLMPPVAWVGVIWEELSVWQGLASVFCIQFVFCLVFNGLVCDGCDNALKEG